MGKAVIERVWRGKWDNLAGHLTILSVKTINKPFDTWLKERIRDEVIRLI